MKYFKVHHIATILLLLGVILGIWYLVLGGYLYGNIRIPDYNKAIKIQPFFAGIVVPLLTLGSALLVYGNLRSTAKQNFSSNFFKLIEMHHKLRDNLSEAIFNISTADKPSLGKDIFDDLCLRIYYDYYGIHQNEITTETESIAIVQTTNKNNDLNLGTLDYTNNKFGKDKLYALYDYYFHIHHSSLGHYFRNLYYLVKYADESTFSKRLKVEHLKILRAQLSNYELLLLAYNGLHDYGRNFYLLIEKYELLKSVNDESRLPEGFVKRIIDIEILRNAYPHLKKYFSMSPNNKTIANPTYFLRNIKIGKRRFSLFVYKDMDN